MVRIGCRCANLSWHARDNALTDLSFEIYVSAVRREADGGTNVLRPRQPSHPPRFQVRACSFASGAFAPFAIYLVEQ